MNDKVCSSMFAGEIGVTRNPARITLLCLAALALFAAGCGKSPEEQKAAQAAETAQTTGALLVKSNRPEATIEATHLSPAGEAAPAKPGLVNQPVTGLAPGQYAVVVRSAGWPDLSGAVNVAAGQTTEVTMNFKSGSLHLDSVPGGATVKLGSTVLGQTPMLILELPVGECQLTLEYQTWPPVAFKTTITENVESTATARLPHGKLSVESIPAGATVRLGGQNRGRTPLTLDPLPAGPKKLTLEAEGFPPMTVALTLDDGADLTINRELGTGFQPLEPAALLGAVWVPENKERLTESFDVVGRYAPRNGIVKNLHRQKLFNDWLGKKYRFAGVVKAYDPRDGEIEFVDQSTTLAKYRVVAKLSPEARTGSDLNAASLKGVTLALYGQLTAVEEPRWPSKVITLELTLAELLQGAAP